MTQQNDVTQIERILKYKLPLIKIKARSKLPLEPWLAVKPNGRCAADFSGINFGIRCGEPLADGGFLFVVDVDRRNGGFEALKYLADEHGFEMEPTLTVTTGGGGRHYYYKTIEPLKKCRIAIGVDGQGVGSYVVGPGSTHESGKPYTVEYESEIEPCPGKLYKLLKERSFAFKEDQPHFSETTVVGEGQRNNYLTQVAGSLRRAGLCAEEILGALKVSNSGRCRPPLDGHSLDRIARSVARYHPAMSDVAVIETKKETGPLRGAYKNYTEIALQNRFTALAKSVKGLNSEISDTLLKHSDRQYAQFALGSAFSIVATMAQGGWQLPSLGRGRSGGGLSAYMWFVGPSAAGKNSYRSAVELYVGEVDRRLLFSTFGSSHGLRASLFCSNSGISVIDEFQDELSRIGGSKSGGYLTGILTDMKELTNDLKELKPMVLAKTVYPAIFSPRYTVAGYGTVEGFRAHLTSHIIGGGLLSRFTVVPTIKVPSRIFEDRLDVVPDGQLTALREIYTSGLTKAGKSQQWERELERFHSIGTLMAGKDPVTHAPQFNPHAQALKITAAAKLSIIDFYRDQEAKYMAFIKDNMSATDISPGSVADRAPRVALKTAGWHALGDSRATITVDDVDIGREWAAITAEWLIMETRRGSGDTEHERTCNKILAAFEMTGADDTKLNKRQLYSFVGAHTDPQQMNRALLTLIESGEVMALEKKTGRPLDVEGILPKRGLQFILTSDI